MKAFVNVTTGCIERLVKIGEEEFEPSRPDCIIRDWPEDLSPENMVWPEEESAPILDTEKLLNDAKSAKYTCIKELRETHKNAGLYIPNIGRIQTDLESRINISGALQMADKITASGGTYSETWRLENNDVIEIGISEITLMGLLVSQLVSLCQLRKNQLDDLVKNATTLEELNSIDIEEGWPNEII